MNTNYLSQAVRSFLLVLSGMALMVGLSTAYAQTANPPTGGDVTANFSAIEVGGTGNFGAEVYVYRLISDLRIQSLGGRIYTGVYWPTEGGDISYYGHTQDTVGDIYSTDDVFVDDAIFVGAGGTTRSEFANQVLFDDIEIAGNVLFAGTAGVNTVNFDGTDLDASSVTATFSNTNFMNPGVVDFNGTTDFTDATVIGLDVGSSLPNPLEVGTQTVKTPVANDIAAGNDLIAGANIYAGGEIQVGNDVMHSENNDIVYFGPNDVSSSRLWIGGGSNPEVTGSLFSYTFGASKAINAEAVDRPSGTVTGVRGRAEGSASNTIITGVSGEAYDGVDYVGGAIGRIDSTGAWGLFTGQDAYIGGDLSTTGAITGSSYISASGSISSDASIYTGTPLWGITTGDIVASDDLLADDDIYASGSIGYFYWVWGTRSGLAAGQGPAWFSPDDVSCNPGDYIVACSFRSYYAPTISHGAYTINGGSACRSRFRATDTNASEAQTIAFCFSPDG